MLIKAVGNMVTGWIGDELDKGAFIFRSSFERSSLIQHPFCVSVCVQTKRHRNFLMTATVLYM